VTSLANTHAIDEHHEHISPLSMYFGIFGALLVLTVITVGVSFAGLGTASIYVAMFVAVIKASLVAGYFMHLKWDEKLNVLIFVASLLFMTIFFVLVSADIGYRGQINPETGTFVLRKENAAKLAETIRQAEKAKAAEAAAALANPVVAPVAPAAQPAAAPAPAASRLPQPVH